MSIYSIKQISFTNDYISFNKLIETSITELKNIVAKTYLFRFKLTNDIKIKQIIYITCTDKDIFNGFVNKTCFRIKTYPIPNMLNNTIFKIDKGLIVIYSPLIF